MNVVHPDLPDGYEDDHAGWYGVVIAGPHKFRMHAKYQPDYYSSVCVSCIGMRRDEKCSWQLPDANATMDPWSSCFDPAVMWRGGAGTGDWSNVFARAAESLVQMLLPEKFETVEFRWSDPPARSVDDVCDQK